MTSAGPEMATGGTEVPLVSGQNLQGWDVLPTLGTGPNRRSGGHSRPFFQSFLGGENPCEPICHDLSF